MKRIEKIFTKNLNNIKINGIILLEVSKILK